MSRLRGKAGNGHAIGGLFTFALFGVYVLLSLLIVVIGVNGYKRVVDEGESVGMVRTALGYISGKINSDVGQAGIAVGVREGVQALTLYQRDEEDTLQETVIFFYDGGLYELSYDVEEMDFDPEAGDLLVELAGLSMEAEGKNLIRLTAMAADGREQVLHVPLLGGQEVTAGEREGKAKHRAH